MKRLALFCTVLCCCLISGISAASAATSHVGAAAVVRSSPQVIRPSSSSGCSESAYGETCFSITGSGQYVSTFEVTFTASESWGTSTLVIAGVSNYFKESGSINVKGGHEYSYSVHPDKDVPKGQYCGEYWIGMPLTAACETVE